MIENLGGANVVTLDSGHTPMLSRPKELAQLLNQVAEMTIHPMPGQGRPGGNQ